MNKYLLFFIGIMLAFQSMAQIDQVSVGVAYAEQAFYRLEDGTVNSQSHTDWDLAFSLGQQDAGVFVNEGAALSSNPIAVFSVLTGDFSTLDTTGMVRLYNEEQSWTEGAFNTIKGISPLDFGWGNYDSNTHQIIGDNVYVVQLRNGDFKKIEIQSLVSGIYTFRHADLDGSNEVSNTIDKASFVGKTLAYYSITSNSVIDPEPSVWDFQFTRYSTPLNDGGNIIEYTVTGVLSNAEVEVVQADGIDPMTVDHLDYSGSFVELPTEIGHDWKSFQFSTLSWELPTDRVYFVKSRDNKLWKVQFLDFEGSSTGITTLEKTFEVNVTGLGDNYQDLASFDVFPNPASDQLQIAFEVNSSDQVQINLTNQLGQVLLERSVPVQSGLNVKTLSLDYPAGLYHVSIRTENDVISKTLFIK